MTTFKHTPGPWELSNGARVYAAGKAGPLLATIAYLPKAPGQEMANARLMAAAPELLDALHLLTISCENSDDSALSAPTEHAWRKAMAAIAKATA
jgi:hypothetical protein